MHLSVLVNVFKVKKGTVFYYSGWVRVWNVLYNVFRFSRNCLSKYWFLNSVDIVRKVGIVLNSYSHILSRSDPFWYAYVTWFRYVGCVVLNYVLSKFSRTH